MDRATSCDFFNPSVRVLNMFENLPATDFDREIVCDPGAKTSRTIFLRSSAIVSPDNT